MRCACGGPSTKTCSSESYGRRKTDNGERLRNVFVVDFDGVLCDSAAESGVTAWRAGSRVWPAWQGLEPPSDYLSRFVSLRPVIEMGYQAVLLMRLIHIGLDDETIEGQFHELCARLIEETGCSKAEVILKFGQARNAWIEDDPNDWLGRHSFYPRVIETFAARVKTDPVFISTTKQERFVEILLHSRGIHLPAGRIFGLEAGRSKEDVLDHLLRHPQFDGARFHFVEDRLRTLIRMTERGSLAQVLFYLADWGYNTPKDRDTARSLPRITLLSPADFLAV